MMNVGCEVLCYCRILISITRPSRKPFCPAVSRLVLGLLVCVSLLQIPIPMLHHHAEFTSASELANHVDRQHQGDWGDGEECHWHLILPRDLRGEGTRSHDHFPSDVPNSLPSDVPSDVPVDVAVCAGLGTGWGTSSGDGTTADPNAHENARRIGHGGGLLFDFAFVHQFDHGSRLCLRQRSAPLVGSVDPSVRTCAVLCVIQV